jgi:hypothetical protein
VLYAELEATQAERLRRNATELRLAEKPSKRDVEASRSRLLDFDTRFQMNSRGRFAGRADYLHIENTDVPPDVAAERIIEAFQIPLSTTQTLSAR